MTTRTGVLVLAVLLAACTTTNDPDAKAIEYEYRKSTELHTKLTGRMLDEICPVRRQQWEDYARWVWANNL